MRRIIAVPRQVEAARGGPGGVPLIAVASDRQALDSAMAMIGGRPVDQKTIFSSSAVGLWFSWPKPRTAFGSGAPRRHSAPRRPTVFVDSASASSRMRIAKSTDDRALPRP